MSKDPSITVLSGGVGDERAIALITGRCLSEALEQDFQVNRVEVNTASLPTSLNPETTIVYPALHGEFGEDGQVQALLEAQGIHYCGSDAASSRLCIRKTLSKRTVEAEGVTVVPGRTFDVPGTVPSVAEIKSEFGLDLVLKPEDKGSSVGLHLIESEVDLVQTLGSLEKGSWLVEKRIRGRELSIAVVHGKGLGVVELIPRSGVYDYTAKYTTGETEYRFPAEIDPHIEGRIRTAAETAFAVCGCRDFARVDFMMGPDSTPYFLEINTLPGLTPTSLLPKSASVFGFSFEGIIKELVQPAINRFNSIAEPS